RAISSRHYTDTGLNARRSRRPLARSMGTGLYFRLGPIWSQVSAPPKETNMAEPHIAQKSPYAVELAPGDYWWFRCRGSKSQPFCDGTHKGSEFVDRKSTRLNSSHEWI